MKIRRMREGEEKKVIELEREELYPGLTPRQIRDWAEGEGIFAPLIFVAEVEGEIVGLAVLEAYEIRGKEVLLALDAIAVKKEFQGKGIGRKLLEAALRKAKTRWQRAGFRPVGLLIETIEAASFYEKVFPNCQKLTFKNVWGDGQPIVFFFIPSER